MSFVRWFSECSSQQLDEVGGKCANLGEMLKAGIPVPPGFALSTDAFRFFLAETQIGSRIGAILNACPLDDEHQVEKASADIQSLVRQTPVPASLADGIRAGYQRLAQQCGDDRIPVAVRSSATGEDSADASFAGLHETYLWVRGEDQLMDSTRACWASLYTPRALSYRMKMGLGHESMLLSVGVQQMVRPRAAGVMFTLDPSNGDRSQICIEGNWGLGESVVKGEVTPDRFRVHKVTLELAEQVVCAKTLEYVPEVESGGVNRVDIAPERQTDPCLTTDEVLALAALGKRIERYYGYPMDIEWAIDDRFPFPDGIFIVQARSETVWSRRERKVVDKPQKQALGHVVDFLLRHK